MKAFLRADPYEDPHAIKSLKQRLADQGIQLFFTQKRWQDIDLPSKEPFLWYRNAFVRFSDEGNILDLHKKSDFLLIKSSNDEVVSVNPHVKNNYCYNLTAETTYQQPKHPALPILMATHNRPDYFKLTINSLFYSTKDIPEQEYYFVANQPDEVTKQIIEKLVAVSPNIHAVITDKNLGYAAYNFGSKFFNLDRFIIFEDDGILPSSTRYLYPYWTKQLHYRSTTADYVGFRISEQNRNEYLCKEEQKRGIRYKYLDFDESLLWNYFYPTTNDLPPISGLGSVIDSPAMYKEHRKIGYFQTDLNIYYNSDSVCMTTLPIYHIGANQDMDLGSRTKAPRDLDRFYEGTNIANGEHQVIDLALDWQEHHDQICSK